MTIYAGLGTRLLILCAVLAKGCLLSGCSGGLFGGGGASSLTVRNEATERYISPDLIGVAYTNIDSNTADLFLTDLPVDRLSDPEDGLAGLAGSVVHVHLFLVPSAGDTPIGRTACNVTVRMLVLGGEAGQEGGAGGWSAPVGLYSGAGFVLPTGSPGDSWFGGSMFGASLRLSASTPGFADPLSPAEMAGKFRAPRQPELARELMARVNRASASLANSAQTNAER